MNNVAAGVSFDYRASIQPTRDARDWEACTLVPWALHLPRGAGAQDIEELLLSTLHLERGAITVTTHQPEPYLIRFQRHEDCEKARCRGRFQRRGMTASTSA